MKATANIYLDTRRAKNNKTYPVKIRITWLRDSRYYPANIDLTEDEFQIVMFQKIIIKDKITGKATEKTKRRNDEQTEIYNKLNSLKTKADDILEKMPVFTFDRFEKLFVSNRGASDSIKFAFDAYIAELKAQKAVKTAIGYECAKNSIEGFKPDLKFADITKLFLKQYENYMYEAENSSTTIGIYLRNLRTIFNRAIQAGDIDKSVYPFGKGKYEIPTGQNIKKALTLEEIGLIYNYDAPKGSNREMSRDYWIFSYLCNGMNIKDMCLLKYKNIDSENKFIEFERAKTKSTNKVSKKIRIALKPDSIRIIKKWGQKSISPETYIFPVLSRGLTAERERQLIDQLIGVINDHMKAIRNDLKITKPITTYAARHSFATVLKHSGASSEFIKESLGHSSLTTTENYLKSFEDETLQKTTDVLTSFKKTISGNS